MKFTDIFGSVYEKYLAEVNESNVKSKLDDEIKKFQNLTFESKIEDITLAKYDPGAACIAYLSLKRLNHNIEGNAKVKDFFKISTNENKVCA